MAMPRAILHPAPAREACPASPAEAAEFEAAMAAYKRRSGRQFPTWSEALEVLRGLGYARAGTIPTPHPADRSPRHRAKINRAGAEGERIAAELASRGGICVDAGAAPIYEFATRAGYESALDAARASHGWTCVEGRY